MCAQSFGSAPKSESRIDQIRTKIPANVQITAFMDGHYLRTLKAVENAKRRSRPTLHEPESYLAGGRWTTVSLRAVAAQQPYIYRNAERFDVDRDNRARFVMRAAMRFVAAIDGVIFLLSHATGGHIIEIIIMP